MVRRSFRIGLRLGLLLAILAAVLKAVRSRRSPTDGWTPPPPPSWPPIQEGPVPAEPPLEGRSVEEAPAVVTRSAPAEPAPPEPEPATTAAEPLWVEPEGDVCPPSHPVKGKLSSGLFHLPGMNAYNRTHPDRCYADETAAEEDGLTRAKR